MATTAQRRKGPFHDASGGGPHGNNGITITTTIVDNMTEELPSTSMPSLHGGSTGIGDGGGTSMQQQHEASSPHAPRIKQKQSGVGSGTNAIKAVVKRNFVGTGPFDKHWLNADCCGLFCACLTYCLHLYSIYAICFVLIPPWMSYELDEHGAIIDPATAQMTANMLTVTTGTVAPHHVTAQQAADMPLQGPQAPSLHGTRQLSTVGLMHCTAFCTIALMASLAHFYAMTTDPGAVPPDAKPIVTAAEHAENGGGRPAGMRLCRRCKAFKPDRAHHCSVCNRCIIKMDHHCPWVNNCVGIGNHKYFLLFIFYTFISCGYSMTLVIARFSTCIQDVGPRGHHAAAAHLHEQNMALDGGALQHTTRYRHHRHPNAFSQTCLDRPTQLLTLLGLIIEALLFGMFTSCMMFDQNEVVQHKMTHIDKLKGKTVGGASLSGLAEVFGVGPASRAKKCDDCGSDCSGGGSGISGDAFAKDNKPLPTRFRWDWLSPWSRVCFPPSLRDEVYGFTRPHKNNKASSTAAHRHHGVEMPPLPRGGAAVI